MVWMVSIFALISNYLSLFSRPLWDFPSVLITTGVTITFFSPLARLKYLFIFSFSCIIIIIIISLLVVGGTQPNGPKDMEIDDDAQGLTTER